MADDLPVICSFWHGPLSWLERLCLASFARQGHRVDLYTYEPLDAPPEGVALCDANAVLPVDKLVFYKGRGTPAVFADLFRLELLRQQRGVWADADVYCIKPIIEPASYLFGFERPSSVNCAVLLLPHDSALLADLLSIFGEGPRPLFEEHLPPLRRFEVAVKRIAGMKVPPEYMQYGATGPFALTHYVRKHGLVGLVQPQDVFYPVPYEDIPRLMRAGGSIDTVITRRTVAIHVWRSQLTDRGRASIPLPDPGSALAKLCEKDGIAL